MLWWLTIFNMQRKTHLKVQLIFNPGLFHVYQTSTGQICLMTKACFLMAGQECHFLMGHSCTYSWPSSHRLVTIFLPAEYIHSHRKSKTQVCSLLAAIHLFPSFLTLFFCFFPSIKILFTSSVECLVSLFLCM